MNMKKSEKEFVNKNEFTLMKQVGTYNNENQIVIIVGE